MTSGSATYSPLVQTVGVTPLPVRTPPAGGTACDQVMLSSPPFGRGTTVWIVPFPYEELPMTTARSRSCSTAATISAADAETSVYKDRQRQIRRDIHPAGDVVSITVGVAAARGQYLPLSEKQVGDLDRLLQQAAGIAAQIENNSAQAASQAT